MILVKKSQKNSPKLNFFIKLVPWERFEGIFYNNCIAFLNILITKYDLIFSLKNDQNFQLSKINLL